MSIEDQIAKKLRLLLFEYAQLGGLDELPPDASPEVVEKRKRILAIAGRVGLVEAK